MTDEERKDVQALIDALPRCGVRIQDYHHERCRRAAVMSHPTEAIGDREWRCSEHPGQRENGYDEVESQLAWARALERLESLGFDMVRRER